MHGLTWILCVICTVCEQPALVCHVMVGSYHAYVVFIPRASFMSTLRSGSSPSPMWQQAGPIACTKLPVDVQSSWNIYMCSFKIYGIWPQRDRQTYTHNFRKCSHASVGLAQACPNNIVLDFVGITWYSHDDMYAVLPVVDDWERECVSEVLEAA